MTNIISVESITGRIYFMRGQCQSSAVAYADNLRLKLGGTRYIPMAFTEQGIAMLSSVLKSKRAIAVNIAIMGAFVKMREFLAVNKEFSEKLKILETHLAEHDEQFRIVYEAVRQLISGEEKPKKRIGF